MSHFRSHGIEKFLNPLSVCSIFDRFYWKLKGDFKRMKKSYCAIFASFSNWTHIYLNVHLPLDGFCEIFCQCIFHSTTRAICLGLLSQKSYEPSVFLIMLIRGYSKSVTKMKYLNIPLKKLDENLIQGKQDSFIRQARFSSMNLYDRGKETVCLCYSFLWLFPMSLQWINVK